LPINSRAEFGSATARPSESAPIAEGNFEDLYFVDFYPVTSTRDAPDL
jgi:hypothetical protein